MDHPDDRLLLHPAMVVWAVFGFAGSWASMLIYPGTSKVVADQLTLLTCGFAVLLVSMAVASFYTEVQTNKPKRQ